MIMGLKN